MAHWLVGLAGAMLGLGMATPAIVAWREQGEMPSSGVVMLAAAALLAASGAAAAWQGRRRLRDRGIPASVAAPLVVNALFLGLLGLEVCHGFAREGDVVARSLFFLPPALLLFWGMLTGRAWARHLARWGSFALALLFLGVGCVACVLRPSDQHGPVWVWIACVSVVLGSLLLVGGFHALGRASAKRYFADPRANAA